MVTADVVTLSGKPAYDPTRVAQIRNTVLRKLNPIGPGVIVSVRGTVAATETLPGGVTGEHCRAARRLVGWSLAEHSHVSGVGLQAIGAYERGETVPRPETLAAIVGALEKAGVVFTNDGELSVKLRERADMTSRSGLARS